MFAPSCPNLVSIAQQAPRLLAMAAVSTAALMPLAHAAGVQGQGTWETTLQGRDLDGDLSNGPEAFFDTVLNVTWLADAAYAYTSGYDNEGYMNWEDAQHWAAQLDINGIKGWRLPDVKPVNGSSFDFLSDSFDGTSDTGYNITSAQSELAHLFYVTLGNNGFVDASGNAQPDFGLSNTGQFINIQEYIYWSGLEYERATDYALNFSTLGGRQAYMDKLNDFPAWAIHSGDVGAAITVPVPEPGTYALALTGLAAAFGLRRWGR